MFVTHRVQGLGSLFLVTRKGRCSASTGICSLRHPLARTIADTGLSRVGRRPSHLCLRPVFPSAFRPIPPNPTQVCFIGILSTHSPDLDSPSPTARLFPSSPRGSAPPCSTHQRLLPTDWTLIMPVFPTVTIHPGSFHQLRPLSSISLPTPAATGVTMPIAQMRMARLW